jgi:pimeloyl-ACP methyl ester carboxylesterase
MKKLLVLTFLILSLISTIAKAEILVFVHGYDSSSSVWRNTGIFSYLQSQSWQDAGNLTYFQNRIVYQQAKVLKPYRMVTVDLPSAAPIPIQSAILINYLSYLQQQAPEQSFSIIAHSVGGIVARLAIIENPKLKVKRIITIASPHGGTGMAEAAELIAKTPISILAPIVDADIINQSEILLNQLQREEPGSFLFWLNRQQHPDITYISIVRSDGTLFNKDFYVPSVNQDLRGVLGIKKAISYPSYGKHELQYRDGFIIAQLVNTKAN